MPPPAHSSIGCHPETDLSRLLTTLTLVGAVALLASAVARAQTVRDDLWTTDGSVYAVAANDSGIFLGGQFARVGPAMGSAVAIDAATGAAVAPYPEVDGNVNVVVPDGAGGWYVGGSFHHVQGQARHALARIDAAGNLTAWNPDPTPDATSEVRALAVNGKTVYVGGTFTGIAGSTRRYLVAFDSTGALTPWLPSPDGAVTALTFGNGSVYAGGNFLVLGAQARSGIGSVNTTNGQATLWDPDANGEVDAIALDGSLAFAAGSFTQMEGQARNGLAEIDANGNVTAWAPTVDGPINALSVTQGNLVGSTTVYIGGSFAHVNAVSRPFLASIDVNGNLTAWSPNPNGPVNAVLAHLTLHSVVVYAGGAFTVIGGQARDRAAQLDQNALAGAWNPDVEAAVQCLATGNGVLYLGGQFRFTGGVARQNVAKLSPLTGAATAWNAGADAPVRALLLSGNKLYAGGDFHAYGDLNLDYIGAVTADLGHSVDLPPFNAATNGPVDCFAFDGARLYAGGTFTSASCTCQPATLYPRSNLAAFDTTGNVITGWAPVATNVVRALALRQLPTFPFSTLVYAGGDFDTLGTVERSRVAEIDASGIPTTWAPAVKGATLRSPDEVSALVALTLPPTGAAVYLAGQFSQVAGIARANAGAVDATGGVLAWNPALPGPVGALAPGSGVVYAGGNFDPLGGPAGGGLFALDGSTGAATAWSSGVDATVDALALHAGMLYVGGDFRDAQFRPRYGFAGLSTATTTAVGDAAVPARAVSVWAVPDPSRGGFDLRFTLAAPERVTLRIYDVGGRLVRQLPPADRGPGEQMVSWDGAGQTGAPVRAGVYFARIDGPRAHLVGRIVRVP